VIKCPTGTVEVSLLKAPKQHLGPPSFLLNEYSGFFFQKVKRPGFKLARHIRTVLLLIMNVAVTSLLLCLRVMRRQDFSFSGAFFRIVVKSVCSLYHDFPSPRVYQFGSLLTCFRGIRYSVLLLKTRQKKKFKFFTLLQHLYLLIASVLAGIR
jgi:hypothetical protein